MTNATVTPASPNNNVSPITEYWSRDEKTVKGERLVLAEKRLQTSGEQAIVEARTALLGAEEKLKEAKAKSITNPNFNAIVEAEIEVKEASLILDQSRKTYRDLFGEDSRIG